ncbi:MAG: pyridoxal phosphate-dependent decarboxylase family protein [Solirubrobacteraceae bacterium]
MKISDAHHAAFARSLEAQAAALAECHPEELLSAPGTSSLAGWFLGPKAENQDVLRKLIVGALDAHCQARRDYFPADPAYVTEEVKASPEYRDTVAFVEARLGYLLKQLSGSVPFWSYRWQSHMNWDLTMPSMAGYFATMLYNPNNVAAEASPVTTLLEMQVGDDLCRMLGYTVPADDSPTAIKPWGHITCDGTVANLESMWAARNLKYWPVAVREALRGSPQLAPAKSMAVDLPTGGSGKLVELSGWQTVNLGVDTTLSLTPRLTSEYGIPASVVGEVFGASCPYSLQNIGMLELYRRFLPDLKPRMPAMFGPSTMHYSWPKAAAVLGLGSNNMHPVHVDLYARMDVEHLRSRLKECAAERRPVVMVVGVAGSTEESAVDPFVEIVRVREECRRAGLEFELHADAAWGGYFASILRADPHAAPELRAVRAKREYAPAMCMSPYVVAQYEALSHTDSITVDPHKAGYCAYPAGGLCYRNGAMRDLVAFTAPVVYHGGVDPTVGVYGIEGSKPGAASAGVHLSHRAIRTDESGYGQILGKSFWSSKRLYAALITMAGEEENFTITPFQRLPAEAAGEPPAKVRKQYEYVRDEIVPKTNGELLADPTAMKLFRELGSDQIIVAYAFNFKHSDGTLNRDLALANELNNAIFTTLSLQKLEGAHVPKVPMFVTSSEFEPQTYGQPFVDEFARRLGVEAEPGESIAFLVTTTMDPWLTDTAKGSFVPTLIQVLRQTVEHCIEKLKQAPRAA